jgi:hypothetical protein
VGTSESIDRTNPATYSWSAESESGGDLLTIPAFDAKYPANNQFYLAIVGDGLDSYYSLVASVNDSAIVLRDGIAQEDHVDQTRNRYYSFELGTANCSVTFSITPFNGDPDLYISRDDPRPDENHNEKSAVVYGADTIVYDSPAPVGQYYIGVRGYISSLYTIVASTVCTGSEPTDDFIQLQDGTPQNGQLFEGKFRYYKIRITNMTALSISVTRRSGDPDLYVS